MQSKALLCCTSLAFTASTLATSTDTSAPEKEYSITNVAGTLVLLDAPATHLGKREEYLTKQAPLGNGLQARSPQSEDPIHTVITTVTATVTEAITEAATSTVELLGRNVRELEARDSQEISEVIEAAMPAEVKKALVDDPNAAESLAKEFSGTSVPEWYAKMPASVTNYYATITPPPTMTGYAAAVSAPGVGDTDSALRDWVSKVKSYESNIQSVVAAKSKSAASESKEASSLSVKASSMSKDANQRSDQALVTKAYDESNLAVAKSHQASVQSSLAASASLAVFGNGSPASASDTTLALMSSVVGAAVCLGFALVL